MLPLYATDTSLVPSAEEAKPFQRCSEARDVQFTPLSVDVHMLPLFALATNLVPSVDEAIPLYQFRDAARDVQDAPLSVEVHIFPP